MRALTLASTLITLFCLAPGCSSGADGTANSVGVGDGGCTQTLLTSEAECFAAGAQWVAPLVMGSGASAGAITCTADMDCMAAYSPGAGACAEVSCLSSYCIYTASSSLCPPGTSNTPDAGSSGSADATSGCAPSCAGKTCGDDGCGGTCGACANGDVCSAAGVCTALTDCTDTCESIGWACGVVCGASCGECAGDGECQDGVCSCVGSCVGKECGDDGCGNTCGTCTGGTICNANGACSFECSPSCTDKECGDDGCGGSCGTCSPGVTCVDSQCQDTACTPNCAGKECGDDGCGGNCGMCLTGQTCSAAGTCEGEGVAGGASCYDTYNCMGQCGQDTACAQQCQSLASAQAIAELESFVGCVQNNGCQTLGCYGDFCSMEAAECFYDIHGAGNCNDLAMCLNGCAQTDPPCQNGCLNQGSLVAQAQFLALNFCFQEACPTQAQDCYTAAQQPGGACDSQIQACFAP